MYVMSMHQTFLGATDEGHLIQMPMEQEYISRFIAVESQDGRLKIRDARLAAFEVQTHQGGVSIKAGDGYVCALPVGNKVVADRDSVGAWETFVLVPDERFKEITAPSTEVELMRLTSSIARLTDEGAPVKLHFGCGKVPRPGFLNIDIGVYAPSFALSNPHDYFVFPFGDINWRMPNDCVDYIYHEDMIEHMPQIMQWQFLCEALRVLKPGGWHRINTPNLLAAMKRHSDFTKGVEGVYTGELQYGHIAILTPASLKEIAETIGYREVVFTTKSRGVSPYAECDTRPHGDRDEVLGNIYADLLK